MINENGISYWSEPLVKEMKTRAYPDGTMVKEPRKAFLLFQEYLHLEYLKNKVADDRYKDPLTKKLAEYNSNAYDDIYETVIIDDFDINDNNSNI